MARFDLLGPATPDSPPESPVVLSVPHAGREYPLELRAMLRVPLRALEALEDRLIDEVAIAARTAETTLIQRAPRAWIDLNRAEHERDPLLDDGVSPDARPAATAKVRSGLGLVPRRTTQAGELWRRRLCGGEVERRIVGDHRPYHQALDAALSAARTRFGTAVLLDLHSMPSLPGRDPATIVLGDRFGRSAGARFVGRMEAEIVGAGLRLATNAPYAGGHILDRHARPAAGIHGVQLEIDRSLYLDRGARAAGAGFRSVVALVRALIAALADEALAAPIALAAE